MSDLPSFILTREEIDRDKDVLPIENGIYKYFLKYPVMLYKHYDEIGLWENIEILEKEIKATPNLNPSHERYQYFRDSILSGFLRGASIGYLPIKSFKNDNGIRVLSEWELMECSILGVQSNRSALSEIEKKSLEQKNASGIVYRELKLAIVRQKIEVKQVNKKTSDMTQLKNIAKAMGLGEDATEQDIIAHIGDITSAGEQKSGQTQEVQSPAPTRGEQLNTAMLQALDELKGTVAEIQKQVGVTTTEQKSAQTQEVQSPAPPQAFSFQDATEQLRKELLETKGVAQGAPGAQGETLRDLEIKSPGLVARMIEEEPERYQKLFEAQYGKASR